MNAADAASAPGVRGEGAAPALLGPGQAMEYVLGVITVMVALAVFAFALRRLQQRQAFGGGSLMRVCASLPLGGKERLLLVEADGERLLLGVSPGGVQLVRRLSPSGAASSPQEPVQGKWLSRVLNGEGAR
jgi:flagellar protein FliO/FliZ